MAPSTTHSTDKIHTKGANQINSYTKIQTHQHQLINTMIHQRIKSKKKKRANKLKNYKDLKER